MKWYFWVGMVVISLAGISTLLPTGASKDCYLGYEAHCTFTPISTIMCLGLVGALLFFGNMKKEKDIEPEEEEPKKEKKSTGKKGKKGKKKK